ncbi:hypothetical protein [Streptomyces sp. 6N106]|uniref:hypothetical protein n=1 Tax=Streptomyces sp. 6N106 TaxID=3457418 RepID=UPI003FD5CEDF
MSTQVWVSWGEPSGIVVATPGPVAERIVARMDAYAERWHALPDGGSLTVGWTCEPAAWARSAVRKRPARRAAIPRRR